MKERRYNYHIKDESGLVVLTDRIIEANKGVSIRKSTAEGLETFNGKQLLADRPEGMSEEDLIGDTMCIANYYVMTDPFMNIICGKENLEQAQLQSQVTGVFKYELEPNKIATYRVDKLEDDWARGTYNEYVFGYTWFTHNKNGKWEVVWKSQEVGLCSDMKKMGIPPSLYESCYMEDGKVLKYGAITFPKKESDLKAGQTYKLAWTPASGKINIFLVNKAAESQGVSVSLFDRVYNIPNSGEYEYRVPANLPAGEYKLEIGDLVSNYFTISK